MKRTFSLFFIIVLMASSCATVAAADESREQLKKEIRSYKHLFLARELNLSREQQNAFFQLYDRMEDETEQLTFETRELERRINESDPEKVSDLEYQKAAEAMFELKGKEGEIEMGYLKQFAEILSPRQLFILKKAERGFSKELMDRQMRLRANSMKK